MKSTKKYILIISIVLLSQNAISQNSYELLYLKAAYEQLLEESISQEDTISIFWHATAHDKLGNPLQAILILENGLEKFDENCSLELAYADLLYKTGQHAKAKPFLLKHHKNPDVFMKLIRTFELASDHPSAISFLEERLETDSMNIEYLARLGDNYNEVERELSARKAYKKVVRLNPYDVVVLGKLANLCLKITEPDQYTNAISYCNLALESDSSNRTIIQIKGIAEFRKGDFEMAEESFKYLLEQGDSSIRILKHLGISEYKLYYYEESYDHLFLAHKKDTADHELCYFMAKDLNFMDAADSALFYLNLAEKLIHPKPAVQVAILVEKAASYTDLYQNEKAIELYTSAYNIEPRPDYLFFIASLYENRIKDKAMALDYYMWFLSQLPEPKENEDHDQPRPTKRTQVITLKQTAELNIEKLKEELFFNGELTRDTTKVIQVFEW